jgi:polysaccharide export outer membrane protein
MKRMFRVGIIVFSFLLLLSSSPFAEEQEPVTELPTMTTDAPATQAEEPTPQIVKARDPRSLYTVGVGDTLLVRLREGIKLNEFEATVMSTGTIVISFVEILAAGHTIPEIREQAQQELGKYIRDFSVDLIAKEWREKKIFILGEVEKPGVYNFTPGVTLMQALALAGGYKNTAILTDMRIIRGNLNNNPELIRANIKAAAKGKDTHDVVLAQNDVIYVPRNTIGDWNNFLNLYIRPTIEVLSLPISGAATVKTLAP